MSARKLSRLPRVRRESTADRGSLLPVHPPLKVAIFRGDAIDHVEELPDPRDSFVRLFNEQCADLGLRAETIEPTVRLALVDPEGPAGEVFDWVGPPFTLNHRNGVMAGQVVRRYCEWQAENKDAVQPLSLVLLPV